MTGPVALPTPNHPICAVFAARIGWCASDFRDFGGNHVCNAYQVSVLVAPTC